MEHSTEESKQYFNKLYKEAEIRTQKGEHNNPEIGEPDYKITDYKQISGKNLNELRSTKKKAMK